MKREIIKDKNGHTTGKDKHGIIITEGDTVRETIEGYTGRIRINDYKMIVTTIGFGDVTKKTFLTIDKGSIHSPLCMENPELEIIDTAGTVA